MNKAFTMIELIFVIVILGILAATAIPKLSATRDDAKASKLAHNVMLAAEEIASYAVANGKTENDMTEMSNALVYLKKSNEAILTTKKATISAGGINDCLTIEIFSNLTDENLTITEGTPSGDAQCIVLQSLIDAAKYPMKLRGQNVKY